MSYRREYHEIKLVGDNGGPDFEAASTSIRTVLDVVSRYRQTKFPSLDQFVADYETILKFIEKGPLRSTARLRLSILARTYRMHVILNKHIEEPFCSSEDIGPAIPLDALPVVDPLASRPADATPQGTWSPFYSERILSIHDLRTDTLTRAASRWHISDMNRHIDRCIELICRENERAAALAVMRQLPRYERLVLLVPAPSTGVRVLSAAAAAAARPPGSSPVTSASYPSLIGTSAGAAFSDGGAPDGGATVPSLDNDALFRLGFDTVRAAVVHDAALFALATSRGYPDPTGLASGSIFGGDASAAEPPRAASPDASPPPVAAVPSAGAGGHVDDVCAVVAAVAVEASAPPAFTFGVYVATLRWSTARVGVGLSRVAFRVVEHERGGSDADEAAAAMNAAGSAPVPATPGMPSCGDWLSGYGAQASLPQAPAETAARGAVGHPSGPHLHTAAGVVGGLACALLLADSVAVRGHALLELPAYSYLFYVLRVPLIVDGAATAPNPMALLTGPANPASTRMIARGLSVVVGSSTVASGRLDGSPFASVHPLMHAFAAAADVGAFSQSELLECVAAAITSCNLPSDTQRRLLALMRLCAAVCCAMRHHLPADGDRCDTSAPGHAGGRASVPTQSPSPHRPLGERSSGAGPLYGDPMLPLSASRGPSVDVWGGAAALGAAVRASEVSYVGSVRDLFRQRTWLTEAALLSSALCKGGAAATAPPPGPPRPLAVGVPPALAAALDACCAVPSAVLAGVVARGGRARACRWLAWLTAHGRDDAFRGDVVALLDAPPAGVAGGSSAASSVSSEYSPAVAAPHGASAAAMALSSGDADASASRLQRGAPPSLQRCALPDGTCPGCAACAAAAVVGGADSGAVPPPAVHGGDDDDDDDGASDGGASSVSADGSEACVPFQRLLIEGPYDHDRTSTARRATKMLFMHALHRRQHYVAGWARAARQPTGATHGRRAATAGGAGVIPPPHGGVAGGDGVGSGDPTASSCGCARGCQPSLPDAATFLHDYRDLVAFANDRTAAAVAGDRLRLLDLKFGLHEDVNHPAEEAFGADGPRDFYLAPRCDAHVHLAAIMTAPQLLRFLQTKAATSATDVVGIDDATREPITLADVLRAAGVTVGAKADDMSAVCGSVSEPRSVHGDVTSLSVSTLRVQADRSLFERFDVFNNRYAPLGVQELRSLLLKTDNWHGGRYFAELVKLSLFEALALSPNTSSEPRVSVYGRNKTEWAALARWFHRNGMSHPRVRYLVQIPRIYGILASSPRPPIRSFGELLDNIFCPLEEVLRDHRVDPELASFLQHISGFDCVDDERDLDLNDSALLVPPHEWVRKENPPYVYWVYHLWHRIQTLNAIIRCSRQGGGQPQQPPPPPADGSLPPLSPPQPANRRVLVQPFAFRPHCGEAGSVDHLATAFLLCDGIAHGVNLRHNTPLQYLYFLAQIPIAMSPLSNNALYLAVQKNPFPLFFRRGLLVTLSSDDPLQFHHTSDPLLEEYAVAAKVWRLGKVDLCEIARNSVRMSGFTMGEKRAWLGPLHDLSSALGNLSMVTHVPDIRVAFRYETYHDEIGYLEKLPSSGSATDGAARAAARGATRPADATAPSAVYHYDAMPAVRRMSADLAAGVAGTGTADAAVSGVPFPPTDHGTCTAGDGGCGAVLCTTALVPVPRAMWSRRAESIILTERLRMHDAALRSATGGGSSAVASGTVSPLPSTAAAVVGVGSGLVSPGGMASSPVPHPQAGSVTPTVGEASLPQLAEFIGNVAVGVEPVPTAALSIASSHLPPEVYVALFDPAGRSTQLALAAARAAAVKPSARAPAFPPAATTTDALIVATLGDSTSRRVRTQTLQSPTPSTEVRTSSGLRVHDPRRVDDNVAVPTVGPTRSLRGETVPSDPTHAAAASARSAAGSPYASLTEVRLFHGSPEGLTSPPALSPLSRKSLHKLLKPTLDDTRG